MVCKKLFLILSVFHITLLCGQKPVDQTSKPHSAPTTKVEKPDTRPFLLGFSTLNPSKKDEVLKITGTVPEWLKGSFVTVGPSQFELNDSTARYWLDGFAMIHHFDFANKKVTYRNQLMDNTAYYQEAQKKGRIRGSRPDASNQSAWSKLCAAVSNDESARPKYDNANVNVIKHNGKLVALTETPHISYLDSKTLQPCSFCFTDDIKGHFNCAHPIYDSATKEWYNYITHFAHNSEYIIYKVKDGSNKRETIATISAPYPSYMHSFALTKKYIILTEIPFVVSPYDLVLTDKAFIETFAWKPKQKTQFIVVDRASGKLVGKYKTDAFFSLHHANAYDEDGTIVLDVAAYQDPQIIEALYIDSIKKNCNHQFPQAKLNRFTIDIKHKKVSKKTLGSSSVEFPRFNQAYTMKKYRYIWATSSDDKKHMSDKIVKIDSETGKTVQWKKDTFYPSEPLFIPAPHAKKEDEGIVLSLVLDGLSKKSQLIMLDGQTMKEIASAQVPHHIPFTVHGNFIN